MGALASCAACRGFIPAPEAACPNCGARARAGGPAGGGLGVLVVAAGLSVAAVTLSACYGGAPPQCFPYFSDGAVIDPCANGGDRSDMASPGDLSKATDLAQTDLAKEADLGSVADLDSRD